MPGLVLFKRRWGIGSDDLVLPASILSILNIIWIVGLVSIICYYEWQDDKCSKTLKWHLIVYMVFKCLNFCLEAIIAFLSSRGTILDTNRRDGVSLALYIRLALYACEIGWLVYGSYWISQNYTICKKENRAERGVLAVVVFNWAIILGVSLALWCSYDTGGRHWVRMKRYQDSVKNSQRGSHRSKRSSGNARRNWRQRPETEPLLDELATRAYQESWNKRCGLFFCCIKNDTNRNTFSEIATLFTEFFRDLDVVPTDVVAGLFLLRKHQKTKQEYIVSTRKDSIYKYMSGVPIKPNSKFLNLENDNEKIHFDKITLYMRYAMAAYGWPMLFYVHPYSGLYKILQNLSCCCCRSKPNYDIVGDNCCACNFAAIQSFINFKNVNLLYANYHVGIEETPFFVAIDHNEKSIVISIRGTLSLNDVLTDLKADSEPLPMDPVNEEWYGHQGIVQAAIYIRNKLCSDRVIEKAFIENPERKTYELILVGHSLGAGTAAILAILMKKEYPDLHCFAYAPPGGLLSKSCVDATKDFITSCLLGKDVVTRIGLPQLELMRTDLINVIRSCPKPKWNVIAGSLVCCDCFKKHETINEEQFTNCNGQTLVQSTIGDERRHQSLYPPGKILHIVRNHSENEKSTCQKKEILYHAVWVDNKDFDEVLISPTMLNDHMPNNLLEALIQVTTAPCIINSENENDQLLSDCNLEQENLIWDSVLHGSGPNYPNVNAPIAPEESFNDKTLETSNPSDQNQQRSIIFTDMPIAESTPLQEEISDDLFPKRSNSSKCRHALFNLPDESQSFDITAEELRIEGKINNVETGYVLAFGNESQTSAKSDIENEKLPKQVNILTKCIVHEHNDNDFSNDMV